MKIIKRIIVPALKHRLMKVYTGRDANASCLTLHEYLILWRTVILEMLIVQFSGYRDYSGRNVKLIDDL